MRISDSAARLRATQSLATITAFVILFSQTCPRTKAEPTKPPLTELLIGFKARPDHSATTTSFQPLLRDVTGNFSFGFLRTNRTHLSVAVVHVASLEPLWIANGNLQWSEHTEVAFNGSLLITDPKSNLQWSTKTVGDKVTLLNSSSLEILTSDDVVSWRSFDFPGNTLVEGQNFSDAMSLVSSNGQYSMRLGSDFWGLYAAFQGKGAKSQLYLKHTAMQAKAKVVPGNGSLYLRVDSNGYMGTYQIGTVPAVDIVPFGIYTRHVSGPVILRLENDGNLKAYFWSGSEWVKSYEAVSETCELPNPCGPYGLCKSGSGCSCLNNRTECVARGVKSSGTFCGVGKNDFSVLRRVGVDLPFKELMTFETMSSLRECEGICANSCSCWGSFYNNNTGFCYTMDYPIQTVLAVGDESKTGYFKVREGVGRNKVGVVFRVLICVLVGVILVISGIIGVFVYKAWKRKNGNANRFFEEQTGVISPGPYKDLGSASFRSIEMCNR